MAHAMAAFVQAGGCWAPTSAHSGRLSSSQPCNLSVSVPPVGRRRSGRTTIIACSYPEEFPAMKEKLKELDLPVQPQEGDPVVPPGGAGGPKEVKEALRAAKAKYGGAAVTRALQEAKKRFGKPSVGKLALLGGAATLGVVLSGAVLTSLEVLPLVPEALQAVGLAYSVLAASRVLQGKPGALAVSPVQAVIEIVDEGAVRRGRVERTSLVLPRDLDEGTAAAMARLARERDAAVNQAAQVRRGAAEYERVAAEKEALETVALQLAAEREAAMAEVGALKAAVEAVTSRMSDIEEMLAREVGQLRAQNAALETVALQLAQERDAAGAERRALEEVAAQLAHERDSALSELEGLKQVVADLRRRPPPPPGFAPDPGLLMEARVRDIRSQLLDGGHAPPLEEVDALLSHIVDELEVHPPAPSAGP